MALHTRSPLLDLHTGIDTKQLFRTSQMVANYTGIQVPRNKAIVGENAFAHEAGIHQDGMLKDQRTYEIMTPETVGLTHSKLVLGKHSGRHAFRIRLRELGFELTAAELYPAFQRFKQLADRKKTMTDADLQAVATSEISAPEEKYQLVDLQVACGSTGLPTATVRLRDTDDKLVNRRRQFGNMLLTRLPILSSRNHLLPKMNLPVELSLQRAALEAVIETPSGPLRVYSIHLNHSSAEERLLQIARLREILAAAPAEGGAWSGRHYNPVWELDGPQPPSPTRAILFGDFNLRPDSEEHAVLLAGEDDFDAARRAAEEGIADWGDGLPIVLRATDGVPRSNLRPTHDVIDTLEAALWCATHGKDFETALVEAVNLGGSAATIGAVAGALRGARDGIDAIPERWLRVLQDRLIHDRLASKIAAHFVVSS